MISNCSNAILLWLFLLLFTYSPSSLLAEKLADFNQFCLSINGQWQGTSAKMRQQPVATLVKASCSPDKRQLIILVSRSAKYSLSVTWWFRFKERTVSLIYYDGLNEDKRQDFSLYHQTGSYTLLGEGKIDKRPSLIQLRFETRDDGWIWLQNVQYLDDDHERYLFYRGIEMLPATIK